MTTASQMKARIRRLAEDSTLDDDLLFDAIRGSLYAILPWHSKAATSEITATSASLYTLPTDFYQVDGVLSGETERFLPAASITKDTYMGESLEGVNWLIYPEGYLSLYGKYDAGDIFTLYYQARWEVPIAEHDTLDLPPYLETATLYWATAYALNPDAASAASIRQYGTKADSGTPEHNPMAKHVLFLLKLFELEVQRHARSVRGEKY